MEKEIVIMEVNASKGRIVSYWITTGIVALQVADGAYFDLTRYPAFSQLAQHLGYPLYLLTFLGTVRILALIALLAPGFPRLKEWTYAGLFFEFTLAIVSHLTMGDGIKVWISPLVFIGLLMASWYLRPASRTL